MANALLSRINDLVEKLLLLEEPSEPPHHLQVQDDLEELKSMVRRIQAVLSDAEKMEIHNDSVKLWLTELKSVAYDAEDVLDEYNYELLRVKVEAAAAQGDEATHLARRPQRYQLEVSEPTQITSIPWDDASFWGEIAGRIGKIRSKFEKIANQRDALHLRMGDGERQHKASDRPPTSHVVDTPNIHGRKDDVEKILGLLLSSDEGRKNNVLVLPIVGMGGVGKTTLAQHIYNHEEVHDRLFQLKGWVCVSDDFTVEKLTVRIIESLSRRPCLLNEFSALQEALVREVRGKRFLLVLDDVWNENPRLWDSLQKPFRFGAQGSAVIATTRSEIVANIMKTVTSFHRLDCLSTDDCWAVFKESAFVDRDPSDTPDLMQMGKMIAKKCSGLPLAAKSLGGLLKHENEVDRWEEILQNDIWDIDHHDGIMPALRLSYLHLPGYLKPCFLYTSTFPKDSRITKNVLVLQWMAQGFIQCKGGRQAEDVGSTYFHELVQRSFLQCHPECLNQKDPDFVMHDHIHDLAKSISGQEFFHMAGMAGHVSRLGTEVRHLSLVDGMVGCLGKMLCAPSCRAPMRTIRTLVVLPTIYDFEMKFPSQMIPQMGLLRVLDLSTSSIHELPESVGNLKLLRYLNLEYTRIKKLPDSICKLYYLQTLSLKNCTCLMSLPKDVKNLHNLRFLELGGTKLYFLPRGIGKLTSLRALDKFIVGRRWPILDKYFPWTEEDYSDLWLQISKVECGGIEELKDLIHLRGRLVISDLQCVLNAEDARVADLQSKRNIRELVLCWVEEHLYAFPPVPATPDVQLRVLENLRPSDHLEVLEIHHYGGLRFPIWRADSPSSFSKLTRVKLFRCGQCACLPPLGRLPSLKHLEIEGMGMVRAVGQEFYGRTAGPGFPALEQLVFSYMDRWVAWELAAAGRGEHFPRLRHLGVSHCPVLESMAPLYLLPVLKELHIWRCPKLASIELQGGPSSTSSYSPFVEPPSLTTMIIQECPLARFLPEDDEHLSLPPTLRDLNIDGDCPLLVEWCKKGGQSRLGRVPNAKVWSVGDGKYMVSTSSTTWGYSGTILKFSSFFVTREVPTGSQT